MIKLKLTCAVWEEDVYFLFDSSRSGHVIASVLSGDKSTLPFHGGDPERLQTSDKHVNSRCDVGSVLTGHIQAVLCL